MVRDKNEGAQFRRDGQLYQRPRPDLMSNSYRMGYSDGYDGHAAAPDFEHDENYQIGYSNGQVDNAEERDTLDEMGSSNA